jgi:hypothetical protein
VQGDPGVPGEISQADLDTALSPLPLGVVAYAMCPSTNQNSLAANTDTAIASLTMTFHPVLGRWYKFVGIASISPAQIGNCYIYMRVSNLSPTSKMTYAQATMDALEIHTLHSERLMRPTTAAYDVDITCTLIVRPTVAVNVMNANFPAQIWVEDMGLAF